jgi:hypothetical protein
MREVRTHLVLSALRFIGWAAVLLALATATALMLNPELRDWL